MTDYVTLMYGPIHYPVTFQCTQCQKCAQNWNRVGVQGSAQLDILSAEALQIAVALLPFLSADACEV